MAPVHFSPPPPAMQGRETKNFGPVVIFFDWAFREDAEFLANNDIETRAKFPPLQLPISCWLPNK